jgi:membrane-associated phospholipid phosphatase
VARSFEGTTISTYPSGTVAVVAALATAALLVSPGIAKVPIAVLGICAVVAVTAAILILRWHYLTDAAGGVSIGAGCVLVVDGSLLWYGGRLARNRAQGRMSD